MVAREEVFPGLSRTKGEGGGMSPPIGLGRLAAPSSTSGDVRGLPCARS